MRKSACTPDEWAWLEERYPSTPTSDLLDDFEERFGHRPNNGTVAARMSGKGIRRDVNRIRWDAEKKAFFIEIVPGHTEPEIRELFAERFGIVLTEGQIGNAKKTLGVKSGTHGGRFEKGLVPANKGKTWDEMGYSPELQARMRETSFKKGEVQDRPDGWIKPVGYERISKDGYVEVKVRDSRIDGIQPKESGSFNCNYRMKHHVVWEQHNGPIPPSTMIVFADRDKRNFDPSNLVAVPRDQWSVVTRQGIPYYDAESLEAAMNVAKLSKMKSKIKRRPRPRKTCGKEFEPRYARQKTCDVCLGRTGNGDNHR